MTENAKLTHCRYCVVEDGRHEDDCLITLRGCTQDDVPLEVAYRKGVHQAFAMLSLWLKDRPNVDVRDLLYQARTLSRDARSDRGPRKWLMHDLLERLRPCALASTPIERLREVLHAAAESAERARDRDPLMEDVSPSMSTQDGSYVGAHVFNAFVNVFNALNEIAAKDQKESV